MPIFYIPGSLKTEAREQKFKAILDYIQDFRAAWNMSGCFSKVGKHKQGQPDFRLIGVHLGTWQNIAATEGSVRESRQAQEDLESSSPTWPSGCQQPCHCNHLASSRLDTEPTFQGAQQPSRVLFCCPGHSLPVSSSKRDFLCPHLPGGLMACGTPEAYANVC